MSDPSIPSPHTTAVILLDPQHHRNHQAAALLPHTDANTAAANTSNSSISPSSTSLSREYRKGNWTLHETLALITAKRMDDERRTRGAISPADTKPPHPQNNQHCRSAELRWKWVENYCWKNGCQRSQNQCNDKWDNLLRDYKKVRDYETRRVSSDGGKDRLSYWAMEKQHRKERNLPSNLVAEVFDALTDVLSRRNAHKTGANAIATPLSSSRPLPLPPPLPPPPPPLLHQQQQLATSHTPPPPPPQPPQQQQQQQQQQQAPTHTPPPQQPSPPPPPPLQQQQQSVSEMSDSSETDVNDRLDSDSKRRKVRSVGSSVARSASVLARTLLACEEKRDQRHRDLLELEERRLRIEEDRNEMNRQGIAGLIAAVNNLSGAIHALVSEHRNEDNR